MSGACNLNASTTQSLLTVLYAFAKSILRKTLSSSMLFMKDRAAWAAASAPKRTPAPSCMGAIIVAIFLVITLAAHLPASRLNVLPTAIGLKHHIFWSTLFGILNNYADHKKIHLIYQGFFIPPSCPVSIVIRGHQSQSSNISAKQNHSGFVFWLDAINNSLWPLVNNFNSTEGIKNA